MFSRTAFRPLLLVFALLPPVHAQHDPRSPDAVEIARALEGVVATTRAADFIPPAPPVTSRDPEVSLLLRRVVEADAPRDMRRAFDDLALKAISSSQAALVAGALAARPGTPWHDREAALRHLEFAAQAGLPEARFRLGRELLTIPRTGGRAAAEKWLALAAPDHPESVYLIALLRAEDAPAPAAMITDVVVKAAFAGLADAQLGLARLLHASPDARTRAWSVAWLEKAAAGGSAEATYEMALLLASRSKADDATRVITLLQRAADRGSPPAMAELARRYRMADGASRDTEHAYRLARQAAIAGNAPGQYLLGTLLSEGIGTGANEAAAIGWFMLAAGQGHRDAMFAVATSYANGWGVGKSTDLANRWYCRAALAGHASARTIVDRNTPGSCRAEPASK